MCSTWIYRKVGTFVFFSSFDTETKVILDQAVIVDEQQNLLQGRKS